MVFHVAVQMPHGKYLAVPKIFGTTVPFPVGLIRKIKWKEYGLVS